MKNTLKNLKRRGFFLLLFFSLTLLPAQFYFSQSAFSDGGEGAPLCGVTDQQCVNYLTARGYTNVHVIGYSGCHRICDTSNPYNTTVFVASGIIIGHEDDPH